jgi:hypothetical protein
MPATRTHEGDRGQVGYAPYLGWSHRNSRLEMMDLPGYLNSLRQSYDTVRDAYGSMFAAMPGLYQPGVAGDRPAGHRSGCGCGDHGRERGDEHRGGGHRHPHDRHGCGCGSDDSCRCTCCIEDADIVVYAHCGELRVIPIEIDNDSRRAREDVSLDVSDVRTAGGRRLPWRAVATVQGPLTLDACSTTRIEVLVHVACGDDSAEGGQNRGDDTDAERKERAGDRTEEAGDDQRTERSQSLRSAFGSRLAAHFVDVDDCVVGYFTVRLGGCLTRPIVVAVAALPVACDSYHADCARC